MRLAALYDIHANLAALEAVLAEAHALGVETLVIGGDVLPGPQPRQTLECLRRAGLPLHCLRGNGDREVIAARRGQPNHTMPEIVQRELAWCAERISGEDEDWLSNWPATLQLEAGGNEVFFCHATARNDTEIFTERTAAERVALGFAGIRPGAIVCGHTHMQFDRRVGDWRMLNAGSVGVPFGDRRACWLGIGDGFELRRTEYVLDRSALESDYPSGPGSDVEWIVNPPSAEDMLALFGRNELQ